MAESATRSAATSRIERVTGGKLAPIEIGNKPYGVRPKVTENRRYNPADQRPSGGARATMARGGKGWSAPKQSATPRYTAPRQGTSAARNSQFGPSVTGGTAFPSK
jgi:hypothetical protein